MKELVKVWSGVTEQGETVTVWQERGFQNDGYAVNLECKDGRHFGFLIDKDTAYNMGVALMHGQC